MEVIRFPRALRHVRASESSRADSIAIKRSSEMSGNARMISGQASRGNWLRCFHARTAPGRLPTAAAKTAGPPFSSMVDDGVGIGMDRALPIVTYKGKPLITHGNVTVGNVACMTANDDGSWQKLEEPWQRLKWARERWQRRTMQKLGTAEQAAAALGMPGGTYRAYERAPGTSKAIKLSHEMAERFGRAFGVNWIWLLTGQGSPFDVLEFASDAIEAVVRAMAALPKDRQNAIAVTVRAMIEAFGTEAPVHRVRYRK